MPSPTDTMDGEDEIDDEEDRPRFCSLDPPKEVTCKGRRIKTFVEFSEACRRGQVRRYTKKSCRLPLGRPNPVTFAYGKFRTPSNTLNLLQHSFPCTAVLQYNKRSAKVVQYLHTCRFGALLLAALEDSLRTAVLHPLHISLQQPISTIVRTAYDTRGLSSSPQKEK